MSALNSYIQSSKVDSDHVWEGRSKGMEKGRKEVDFEMLGIWKSNITIKKYFHKAS